MLGTAVDFFFFELRTGLDFYLELYLFLQILCMPLNGISSFFEKWATSLTFVRPERQQCPEKSLSARPHTHHRAPEGRPHPSGAGPQVAQSTQRTSAAAASPTGKDAVCAHSRVRQRHLLDIFAFDGSQGKKSVTWAAWR